MLTNQINMQQKHFFITVSDNIPFSFIEKQLGVVDAQIVIGANIFRDVFANWRDLFGGETKGYKKDIDKMKHAALSSIEKQAKKKGANAIISLKMDLDELSGGGKSMFMINIYGSAIKLTENALGSEEWGSSISELSFENVEYFKARNKINRKLVEKNGSFSSTDINLISEYELWNKKFANIFLKSALKSSSNDGKALSLKANISHIPVNILEDFLDENLHKLSITCWGIILKDLEQRGWFNYNLMIKMLNDDNYIRRFRALKLCSLKKSQFEKSDIKKMNEIGNLLQNDFNHIFKTTVVSKIIGSKKTYVCPGCLRDRKIDHCECYSNKYGIKHGTQEFLTPSTIGQNMIDIAEAIESAFNSTKY